MLARDRTKAAVAAVVLQALIGYAFVAWLIGAPGPEAARQALKVFTLAEAPAPPRVVSVPPRQRRSVRPEGAASPPNLRATATPLVAPPIVPLVPPPVLAAPAPGRGFDASAGASDVRGPGTGSGGYGNGTGSGGAGDGDSDGGDIPPRHLRGRLKDSDYPRGLGEEGIEGTVSVRYRVDTDGRARDCRVTRSSGSRELDFTTCRLIEERFRFDPSHDRDGRPVPSILIEDHSWIVHDEPPERR